MRYIVFAVLVCIVGEALAVPAKRMKRWMTLDDGSQKELTLQGDEFCHYYVDDDGQAYELSEGKLLTTSPVSMNQRRLARAQRANVTRAERKRTIFKGRKRGLVILVNFQDKAFSLDDPKATFEKIFNQPGYNEGDFYGSVHDYFYACSYGQFDLEFDVVGPYTLSQVMSYYGGNDSEGNDRHPGKMIIEACNAADADVNFAEYDWSGDGYVDQVYVLYAGYAESQNASEDTVWPHEWDLASAQQSRDGSGPINTDGVTINTYACSSELAGNYGKYIDGIGTACHEFSHCLGLPDMYDTAGSSFGMHSWDLLDYGCYNEDGYCPAPFTSYERMYCGWMEPIVLAEPCSIRDMQAITDGPTAYIIYNEAEPREFYMLENHQKKDWDSGAFGHGLLILHVDYNEDVWNDNRVNTVASHQRMTIIPADNTKKGTESSLAGDPYPGTYFNTQLTDSSTPAATLYKANTTGTKFMGKPITGITEDSKGLISFDFMGGGDVLSDVQELQETDADGPIIIYTLDGKLVTECTTQTLSHLPLRSGLYVVRSANGKSKKIYYKQ